MVSFKHGGPARSAPRQHRAEVSAAEKVHVEVWNFLVAVATGVGEDSITRFGHSSLPRDTPESADQRADLSVRGFRGEIVERSCR